VAVDHDSAPDGSESTPDTFSVAVTSTVHRLRITNDALPDEGESKTAATRHPSGPWPEGLMGPRLPHGEFQGTGTRLIRVSRPRRATALRCAMICDAPVTCTTLSLWELR